MGMECERLTMRPLTVMELMEILSEGQKIITESALTEIIRDAIKNKIDTMQRTPKEVHEWLTYWLITTRQKGQGIGLIGSKNLPDEQGYVEIGYIIGREYRRQGYMTEALEGFLDWLYQWPFCTGAELFIRSANLPSVKVAEKCGFRYEGMMDIYRRYRYSF